MAGDLGARIRQRREELKITQGELAQAAGVRYQAVQQWEAGTSAPSRGKVRTRLAAALQWTEQELEFGPAKPAGDKPALSPEAEDLAEAFMQLTPAQRANYLEAILRDVTLARLMGNLPGVRRREGSAQLRKTDSELAREAILAARRASFGD